MAIGEEYPGIEAVVFVGGQKAREYKHDDVFGDLHNISRYIESKDDTEFSIRLLVNEEYKFVPEKHDALGIKVFVDGVKRCTSIWNENRPIDYMYLTGRKIKNQNGTVSIALFKFVALHIVDGEDRDAANLQREQTKDTGKIVVEVSRCRVNAMFKGMAKDTDKELETSPPEMMLKATAGRKLTHRADFGKEVAKSNTAVKYNVTEIDTAGPIARFVFYYRAKHVLEDLEVEKIDESLPPPIRYQDGLFIERNLAQTKTKTAPKIKTEADTTQDSNIGDAYDATPPPLQRQSQAAPTQVQAGNDVILQALLETLSEEQKRNMIQLLTQDNAAQNPETSQPVEAAAAPTRPAIKQERSPSESRRESRLSIYITSRKTHQEHLREGGEIIDIRTPSPVEDTFIKSDPDANVAASSNDNDVVKEGQAEADAASNLSSSTISDSSPVAQCTEAVQIEDQAASVRSPSSLRGRIEAERKLRQQSISIAQVESQGATTITPSTDNAISEVNGTARRDSMSTVDGVVAPKTPTQKPALIRADDTQVYNTDTNFVVMDIGKPTAPRGVALIFEVDDMAQNVKKVADSVGIEAEIVASIEAADCASSTTGISRQRSPSAESLVYQELKVEQQRIRSGHPTLTSVSEVAQNCSNAMSPTSQPDIFMVANIRAVSIYPEAEPVQTIDVDVETGYDVGKDVDNDDDEDYGSPSRQLVRESTEDDDFEMIEKPAQVSEITASEIAASAIASVAVGMPVKTFEEAKAAALAKKEADNEPAERAKSVQIIDKPTGGFAEAILAASSPASKPGKSGNGAATPFPVVDAEVIAANTPISGKKSSPGKQAQVHTDDLDFIDLEAIVPHTPVKNITPAGLTKNANVTTPTSTKATPNTVDRQLSAAGKDMAVLDLNNIPRKRLFSAQTPRSTASVGSPITGNARSGHADAKKSTPIKRRVDDDENDVVETDGTPSKKMKYLSLGSQDAPISFESDDE